VASKVQNESLQGLDEGNTLTRMITKMYTGQEDLAFVDTQKTQIQGIIAELELDITALKAGKECQHFYNPEWDTHTRAKKQRVRNCFSDGVCVMICRDHTVRGLCRGYRL